MGDPFRLEGKTAAVTGALGKLGSVWIEALLEAGAGVVAVDLEGAPVSEPFAQLQKRHGSRLRLDRADVCRREQLEAVLARCPEPPSILVNNAGVDQPPGRVQASWKLEDIPIEINRGVLEINVLGLFLAAQVFGKEMVKRKSGSIINLGSLYAGVSPDARYYSHLPVDPPFLKPPAYSASKGAVISLTRYLATHWGPSGVRVNALSPGGVLGAQDPEFKRKFCERVPLGRLADDADLKGPLLFLASDASRYVTGVELMVDGGYTAW